MFQISSPNLDPCFCIPQVSSKFDDFFDFSSAFSSKFVPLSPINIHQSGELIDQSETDDVLSEKKNNGTVWTSKEDSLLIEAVKEFKGKNWKAIAQRVPGRTFSQCTQRWRRLQPHKTREPWTKIEDRAILNLVEKFGNNWTLISNFIEGRTGKQVRDRYLNKLNPRINRKKFSEKEDSIILEKFKEIGPKWLLISKELHGRSENMIKNRFYSYLKKKLNEDNQGQREEENLQCQEQEKNSINHEELRKMIEEEKRLMINESEFENELDLRNLKDHVEYLRRKKEEIENTLESLTNKINKYENFFRLPEQ